MKEKCSKIKHIQFSQLKLQPYLTSNLLSVEKSQFIFHARSRMLNLRANYSNSYTDDQKFCQICLDENKSDTQEHLFVCDSLVNTNQIIQSEVSYSDIFNTENFSKLIQASSILQENYKRRQMILLQRKQSSTDTSQ